MIIMDEPINVWDVLDDNTWLCITTNGFVKSNGELVMGRGIAKQAAVRYPELPKFLGRMVRENGNNVLVVPNKLITFPVKHNWWEEADTALIRRSAKQLAEIMQRWPQNRRVLLPRPGCGNGKLNWEKDVLPALQKCVTTPVTQHESYNNKTTYTEAYIDLDDRVIVVHA